MILYKYIYNHAIKVLEDLRLKVTPPNEFNDPFELTPDLRFAITLESMLEEARNEPENFRPNWEAMRSHPEWPDTFEKFIAGLPQGITTNFKEFKRRSKIRLKQEALKSIHEASEHLAILCLSKPNDSIPMWSYYAESHKGVAFGIYSLHSSFDNVPENFFNVVDYRRKRYPVYLPLKEQTKFGELLKVMCTKSRVWRHEKEYRRIYKLDKLIAQKVPDRNEPLYFVKIDQNAIREVIFGACVDPKLEKSIRDTIARNPTTLGHISLLRCKRHPTKFKLEIVPA